ncbi:MAG: division plane positioning ATPase MipZ, partial [Paracoccus sp. (in: a-proteobacteria)]
MFYDPHDLAALGWSEFFAAQLAPGENAHDHRLSEAVAALETACDFIVIDCPGSHTRLSQVAHSLAD